MQKDKLDIVIAGKNDIGVYGLELALETFEHHKIAVIVNDTDFGINSYQRSLAWFAKKNGIKVIKFENLYFINTKILLSLEFDKIIDIKRINASIMLNIHFSLLPKYKGMYTSVWPILFMDKWSGVTLHEIDKGIDTGRIISQKVFKILPDDRSQDCYRKYIIASKILLRKNWANIISENIKSEAQKLEPSSYFSKSSIDFKKISIDFNKPASCVKSQVLAYSFRQYQLVKFKKKAIASVEILKIQSDRYPGSLIEKNEGEFRVATKDFDVILYVDNLLTELEKIPTSSLEDVKSGLKNYLGVNDKSVCGKSPIMIAALCGRKDLCEFFLKLGAEINDQDFKGDSVLFYASKYALKTGDIEFFKFILSKGADPNITNWNGQFLKDLLSEKDKGVLGL